MAWFFLFACALRADLEGADDAPSAAVLAADSRFAMRGVDDRGLSDAVAGWTLALAVDPRDRHALGRLAHAHWILALTEPDRAAQLGIGEEFGWRCLLAVPGFGSAVSGGGGVVTARALAALDASSAPCLAWTAANLVDRVAVRGPGARLDLETARILVTRLGRFSNADVAPWDPAGLAGLDEWLDGRVAHLGPADRDAGRPALLAAVVASPGFERFRLDLERAHPDAEAPKRPPVDRWPLENRAVAARPPD